MAFISSYDKELFRHALLSPDERILVALILKIRNPRWAVLLVHQFLVNHLKDGCQGCSMCCKKEWAVDLDSEDLKRIAFYLKMRPEKFLDQYVQKVQGDNYLKDLPSSDSCIFLKKANVVSTLLDPTLAYYILSSENINQTISKKKRIQSAPESPLVVPQHKELTS